MKNCALNAAILLDETGLLKEIFGNGLYYDFRNTKELFDKVRTMGEFIWLLSNNLVENPAEFYKNNLRGDIPTYKEIRALELAFDGGEATNLIEARSIAHNMYVTSQQSLESQIIPNAIKTAAQELLSGKYPKTINELAVNGNDLMQLGLEGKAIGDMQKSLLLKIYADKVRNTKEDLLNLVGQNKGMIKEEISDKIEYGTLLLFLDVPIWKRITSIIDKNDIYDEPGYGIESEPHVTILYGFHDEVTADEVFGLVKENIPLKPIEIGIKGISVFSNSKFDVVKFDVNSPELTKLNGVVKQLPNTTDFPKYHPHITIGYVKPGEGQKYVKPFEKERKIKGTELIFSTKGHKGKNGETLMLSEGVADKYAEKAFNIPDPNTADNVKAMGDMQKNIEEPFVYVEDKYSDGTIIKVPVFKNPKSLTNFDIDVRAIADSKGDLYVAQQNGNFNHGKMAFWLGLAKDDYDVYKNMDEYQLLHRVNESNSFGLGDTAEDYALENYENKVYVLNVLRATKRKNPQYDFFNEYYHRIDTSSKPISLDEYMEYPEIVNDKYLVNGESVDINFFVHKYGEWNAGERFRDPSKESVLRFLEDEYVDLVNDEKLKKELLWALSDRDVLNENAMSRVSYSAVVLDEKSRSRLLERFKSMIPEGWKVIADHVTINMGEIDPEYQKYLGLAIRLSVIDVAIDDKVIAVGVEGFYTKNNKAHITLAVNEKEGGKPMMSNKLSNWEKLKRPLLLTGKVTEVK